MIKKLLVVAVVGGLAVAAVKGTKWASYVRSEVRSWKEAAEDSVPPEAEITRLRSEIKMLDEDTIKIVKQLARLQSDQADLSGREKSLETKKSDTKVRLDALASAVRDADGKVKSGDTNVYVLFGEQKYSIENAKAKLKDNVADYQAFDKELTHVRMKFQTQQRIIDKLDRQRMEMGRLKTDLDAAIDGLEEQVQALKLQQMESKYQTDDTRVAQIKESIAKVNKRLDIQRRELNLLQDTAVVPGTTSPTESVDDILAPLNAKPATKPTIAKSGD